MPSMEIKIINNIFESDVDFSGINGGSIFLKT
jgi:hypothetical protein